MKDTLFTPAQWKTLSLENNAYGVQLTAAQYNFNSIEGLKMIMRHTWWRLKMAHNIKGRMGELTAEERETNHYIMSREIALLRERKERLSVLIQAKLN